MAICFVQRSKLGLPAKKEINLKVSHVSWLAQRIATCTIKTIREDFCLCVCSFQMLFSINKSLWNLKKCNIWLLGCSNEAVNVLKKEKKTTQFTSPLHCTVSYIICDLCIRGKSVMLVEVWDSLLSPPDAVGLNVVLLHVCRDPSVVRARL